MPKKIIKSSKTPITGFTDKSSPSPLAQGVRWGNMLFLSGQVAIDPETKEVISDDIQAQTQQTLRNLEEILKEAGGSFANVVNMRVCLRDVDDFQKFNITFTKFMKGEKVTRTCIGGIPHRAGVKVEIDCIAMFD